MDNPQRISIPTRQHRTPGDLWSAKYWIGEKRDEAGFLEITCLYVDPTLLNRQFLVSQTIDLVAQA
jgi:hypothetical protein